MSDKIYLPSTGEQRVMTDTERANHSRSQFTRRRLIALSVLSTVSLAGCSGDDPGEDNGGRDDNSSTDGGDDEGRNSTESTGNNNDSDGSEADNSDESSGDGEESETDEENGQADDEDGSETDDDQNGPPRSDSNELLVASENLSNRELFNPSTTTQTGGLDDGSTVLTAVEGVNILVYDFKSQRRSVVRLDENESAGDPEVLVDHVGLEQGTITYNSTEQTTLDLVVDTCCPWELQMAYPDPVDEAIRVPPASVSGEKSAVVGPIDISEPTAVRLQHDGQGNFHVVARGTADTTKDQGQELISDELVVDETTQITKQGIVWFEVAAAGSWTISVLGEGGSENG